FLTTHLIIAKPEKWFASLLKSTYDTTLGIKAFKSTYKIITITDAEKIWCIERGVTPQKIISIPNGVDDKAFDDYNATEMKKKYGLNKYIIFIGRMYEEKGPTHLVMAFSKIAENFKDVSLVFVGPDQGEIERVMALSRDLKLHKRVICTGKIPEKDKRELLSGCEFFALPSKNEAQGIVFIEAWAQKKAVIGTNVGGVPYVIEDGETGLLYDYGDINALTKHIEFLLENPDKAEAMGKKGFEIASKEYRWDDIVDKIENLYNDSVDEFGTKS
ncbi:MAG: glycosyltransferase family 4 protein, partial [Thermoplasmata archaeon]